MYLAVLLCVTVLEASASPSTDLQIPSRSLKSVVASVQAIYDLGAVDTRIMGYHNYETVACVGTYKLHREPATWRDSYKRCLEEGAHLAVLETTLEALVVKYLLRENNIKNNRNHSLFVNMGFHSQFSENHWTTIFGYPIHHAYEVWAKYQPDNFGMVERCGAINYNAELLDITCDESENPFICEKRLPNRTNCALSRATQTY